MKRLIFILLASALVACQGTEADIPEDRLVVEAWICSGEPPVVQLSTSLYPTEDEQGMEEIEAHILRRARVTVSDGEREVSLTGMYKKGYLPPYIYTTGYLRGEVGKTYTLTVDASDYHATATATIPEPVPLTSLEPQAYGQSDTTWLLRARFRDRPGEHNYYKAFSRIHKVDSTYLPTRMSLVNDEVIDASQPETEVLLMPGGGLFNTIEQRSCYYSGETVFVRFCTTTREMADVWQAYDSEAVHGGFPILSTPVNVPGNVDGALGYFAGYGSVVQKITLP